MATLPYKVAKRGRSVLPFRILRENVILLRYRGTARIATRSADLRVEGEVRSSEVQMRNLCTLSLSQIVLVAFASAASAQSLTGSYHVTGTSPTGTTYDGTARISISRHGLCRMRGVIESMSIDTNCLFKRHNLMASYVRGGRLVNVVYQRASDGSLNGSWTIEGTPGRGHEVLTPDAR
jgi:hypothetical protein